MAVAQRPDPAPAGDGLPRRGDRPGARLIPARKSRPFRAWFARHAEGRIRSHFSAVHIAGLPRLRAPDAPTLVVSNHTSWWDPMVALLLVDRLAGLDGYAMMDAGNLRKLPFFGLVGAFGVELDGRGDGAEAIRYAASLLDGPQRLVWVFPQGRELPGAGPLTFRSGAAAIAAHAAGARTLPLALRYAHLSQERPELFVRIGAPLPRQPDVEAGRRAQEDAVAAELDVIEQALRAGPRGYAGLGFSTLFHQPEGRLGQLLTRILSWITR